MKVLHLSTADGNGGAARGAYWLHKAQCRMGIDSHMLVADKFTNDPTVTGSTGVTGSQKIYKGIRQTIEYWPLRFYRHKRSSVFSPAIYPSRITAEVEAIDPDIINLHWVTGGLLRPQDLRRFQKERHRRLVWTLRDMWPFTGGCHYAGSCRAYQTRCGRCPLLGSKYKHDLAFHLWQRKQSAWQDVEITVVALSDWLAECARQSKLFSHYSIQVIPNAIDLSKYRPISQTTARNLLNLSQSKKLIIFGALSPTTDRRKGFEHLRGALQHLARQESQYQYEAIVFGCDQPSEDLDLQIPTTFLGYLHDDMTLATAYSAADVMVMPSIEESFGKTAIEAMACGTPVVSFDCGGLKDIVIHQHNGYKARCFDAVDLAKGISFVLRDSVQLERLSQNARQSAEANFSYEKVAAQYFQLYSRLMEF